MLLALYPAMDANTLKGRIAEALVEGVLRRAGYQVAMVGRESRVQDLLRLKRDRFLPDFLVWKALEHADSAWPPYRLIGVEVKYRRDAGEFLRREFTAEVSRAFSEWPELYLVLVTDQPDPGRSCFQVLGPHVPAADEPPATVDLHEAPALDIYRRNVLEHEQLVRMLFPLLGGAPTRRPLARTLAGAPVAARQALHSAVPAASRPLRVAR